MRSPMPITYTQNATYSGHTQDVLRVIDEAWQRRATRIEIHRDGWLVILDFPLAAVEKGTSE